MNFYEKCINQLESIKLEMNIMKEGGKFYDEVLNDVNEVDALLYKAIVKVHEIEMFEMIENCR